MKKTNNCEKIRIDGAFTTNDSVTLVTEVNGKWFATRSKEFNHCIKVEKCEAIVLEGASLFKTDYEKERIRARFMAVLTAIVLILAAFKITAVYKNIMAATIVSAFCIDFIFWKGSIINYFVKFWSQFRKSQEKALHAATHKVINAYEKLGFVPSSVEAKRYSKFSVDCENSKNSLGICTLIIMFAIGWVKGEFITPEMTVLVYGVALIVYAIIYKFGLYRYISYYSVKNPNKHELAMAVYALRGHIEFVSQAIINEEEALSEVQKEIVISKEEANTI